VWYWLKELVLEILHVAQQIIQYKYEDATNVWSLNEPLLEFWRVATTNIVPERVTSAVDVLKTKLGSLTSELEQSVTDVESALSRVQSHLSTDQMDDAHFVT